MSKATGRSKPNQELRMEAILSALTEGISVQDRNFRILYQNPAHVQLHGPCVGEFCFEAYANASEVCEGCPIALAFEDGDSHTAVKTTPAKRFVEITASPLKDDNGEVYAAIEIVRDITEKKKDEEVLKRYRQGLQDLVAEKVRNLQEVKDEQQNIKSELRQARAKFGEEKAKSEAIIAAIGDGISIQSTNLVILYENQVHKDYFGEDHVGRFCYQAYAQRDSACDDCPVLPAMESGGIHRRERWVGEGEKMQCFDITASPLRDDAGNIIAVIEVVRNITEKKKAELALREANVRLEALLNAIPDMVLFKDVQRRNLVVNRAVEQATGHTREELLGKVDEEFIPPEVAAMCRASDEKAMNGREPIHCEESMPGVDGETIFLDTIKAPMHDEQGNLSGVVVVSRDITKRRKAEEALRLSEKRMFKAQQTAQIGNWEWNIKKNELYWSDEVYRIYGREPGRFTPTFEAVREAVHPDDLESFLQAVHAAIQEGRPFEMDFRLLRPDGKERIVHAIGEMTYDGAGQPLCKSGTVQDITERKRLEARTIEQYAILESIVESTDNPIYSVDHHYCYTSFNQGHAGVMKDFYGAGIELGTSILDFIAGEKDRNQVKTDLDLALNGESHMAEAYFGRDDQPRLFEATYNPIRGENGKVVGVAVYARDTTERKRAEEQVRASEKRLRDITSNLGVGVYLQDFEGRIIFMNPMAEQLWGWSLAELQEKGVHELVHYHRADNTSLPLEECELMGVIRKGEAYSSTEEVFVRKDGTVFPISVTTTPLLEDGRVVATVTAFRDITTEKKLEAEILKIQKLESVGILAGGIAHDFNNLLQAILGSISLARVNLEERNMERIPSLLEQAEEASGAAKELSFRLLTFAKGGEPVKGIVAIEEILRKSISLSLSGSNIDCAVDLPLDLPPVEVDGGQMMQVFTNILINAKEAMPRGGTINISAKNMAVTDESPLPLKKGQYLRISIRDNGCGIHAENLSKIFDPYFSVKGMGSRKGTGLGLSICMAIVRKHGGYISVESQPGKGATFHIHIPASSGSLPARITVQKVQPAVSRKRILFMDDDERVRYLVGEMMAALECEVESAENGEKAVALYRKAGDEGRPFTGVVLDLTVKGGMGGEMTMARLREIDPRVRAIIASGYAEDPLVKQFGEYGFVGALSKPFTIAQLKEVLAKL
jgi:PAS domain S-box-containing protein